MSSLVELLWLLLLAPLVLLLVAGIFYVSTKGQMSPRARLELLTPKRFDQVAPRMADCDQWADANGFEWVGAYKSVMPANPEALVFGWKRPNEGIFFALYLVQQAKVTDFVSVYTGKRMLTTASTADALLTPEPPTGVRQGFTGRSLDELWELHCNADQFVQAHLDWQPCDDTRPLDELIMEAIRVQNQHVCSLPFWPLRGVWWFFTKGRRANIPVEQQDLAPVRSPAHALH